MVRRRLLPLAFAALQCVVALASGLAPPAFAHAPHRRRPAPTLQLSQAVGSNIEGEIDQQLLESLRSLRVKELKSELESRGVSTRDAFEKEELVRRLYKSRTEGGTTSVGDAGAADNPRKKKKKRRTYDDDDAADTVDDMAATAASGSWTITAPFVYHELETSKSVAAQNAEDIYIRPSAGKYAAIKVQLKKNGKSVDLTLLVDTACSGLVLSPAAVARANQQIPGILESANNVGATMTMAGSSQGAAVAKWDGYTKLMVGGAEVNHVSMAACQDIGALPTGLDGIWGLSFLDQFACVDFDFATNELRLSKSDPNPLIPNVNDVVARGPLSLTRLRIPAADVTLDGRGPVKLIVDTGAASSFLNWKGVADMRLSSSSPQIEPIKDSIGAMGADNMALQLTHRFKLKRRWNLVAENNAVGDFCPGIGLGENGSSDIDISDLPVLDALKGDGVGGILGADLLLTCDVVRFIGLNGASPSMILMKQ